MIPEEWNGKYVMVYLNQEPYTSEGFIQGIMDDGIVLADKDGKETYISKGSISTASLLDEDCEEGLVNRGELETIIGLTGIFASLMFLSYVISSARRINMGEALVFTVGLLCVYAFLASAIWLTDSGTGKEKVISVLKSGVVVLPVALGIYLSLI
ncbi:MAG: hypothetical protein M1375_02310 [Candidatus Thermoplasmatota archaeon]|jgi:hypothetical protein|nr:hypothetical protein [Candidatus Thermoplasmatota archaeon]MCL5790790.1 hypothetical protein [Candidatus Thermoplasmatota archaeon]